MVMEEEEEEATYNDDDSDFHATEEGDEFCGESPGMSPNLLVIPSLKFLIPRS